MKGRFSSPTFVVAAAVSFVLASSGNQADAAINLELRPSFQATFVGNTVSVGVYAVSDTPASQFMSAVEVIFNWNTTYLSLIGADNTGTPLTGFTPSLAADPYGFNTSLTDGDAMWIGGAPLGSPVAATAAGVLLTTLNFLALAPTAPTTPVSLPATDAPNTGGPTTPTFVYHPTAPNTNIVGTLTGATIQITVPTPSGLLALVGGLVFGRPRRRR